MIPKKVLENAQQIGTNKTYARLYLKAWSEPNKRNIIKAKCIECCGFEDVNRRVRECTVEICPLHQIRMRYFSVR
jgi:hypothetical protein